MPLQPIIRFSTLKSEVKRRYGEKTLMATSALESPIIQRKRKAALSHARERRTMLCYALLAVIGIVPTLLAMAPAWQTAGLGLWFPGAGFLVLGPLGILAAAFTLALFVIAMIAWFGAGMVIAPVIVWGGAAVLAGILAPAEPWAPAPILTVVTAAALLTVMRVKASRKEAADLAARDARNAFLPKAIATLRSEQLAEVPAAKRELDITQLQLIRFALDRAMQPLEKFDGFDRIDQFQTAAIRYQINALAYALALAQCHYTPSFHGYLSAAQRRLIEKYLQRRVWSYWIYESAWGQLNITNFDPAGKDNIMLTGYLGIQVGLYMSNTGDMRYMEPGSLPFRLNASTTYAHNYKSIIRSIVNNFDRSAFCLYPCEPNWIYPICNHYGMTAVTLYDRLSGSGNVTRQLPHWIDMLDTELSDTKGSPIALKSSLTGWMPPFPAADGTYVPFANCFIPERAERLWSIARTEMAPLITQQPDGRERLDLPGAGIDFGNYKKGHAMSYAFIKMAAREMGDARFATLADDALNDVGGLEVDGSLARYSKASTIGNAYAIIGAMQQRNDLRNAVCVGPDSSALSGPILADANYPAVLVARAYSHGEDLELVLHPGRQPSIQCIGIERLVSNRRYAVSGIPGLDTIIADSSGRAKLMVELHGRTAITVKPAA
jgi:hypothetical protein